MQDNSAKIKKNKDNEGQNSKMKDNAGHAGQPGNHAGVIAKHVGVFLSNPSYTKIKFLEVTKRMNGTLMERTRKTDQENGILYYVMMCGSRDIEVWKSQKTADSGR